MHPSRLTPRRDKDVDVTDDLTSLFDDSDRGSQRMMAILRDPGVSQIFANRHDRLFFTDATGQTKAVEKLFTPTTYVTWVNQLMAMTDAGYPDVAVARTGIIEASFDQDKVDLHGSIHVVTRESTGGDPIVTVRKQPREIIQLDDMLKAGMMSQDMRLFLEQAIRGRLNVLLAGGSGAGKTTMLKAMSWFISPDERIVTCEDIRELHFEDRLPNVAGLSTFRLRDDEGRVIRETTLVELVESALRMRPHRIIVGETRGKEAYALTKAMTTGHDGSWTTVHADTAQAAWKQMVGYVVEAGVPEGVARDRVANSFHLAIQVAKGRMGQRIITEITELENVSEGTEQRRNPLYVFNWKHGIYEQVGRPTDRILLHMQRYGVNYDQVPGRR